MGRKWKKWMASGMLAAMLLSELSPGMAAEVQAAAEETVTAEVPMSKTAGATVEEAGGEAAKEAVIKHVDHREPRIPGPGSMGSPGAEKQGQEDGEEILVPEILEWPEEEAEEQKRVEQEMAGRAVEAQTGDISSTYTVAELDAVSGASMTAEEAAGREVFRKYQDTLVPMELPPVVPSLDRGDYPMVSSGEIPVSYDSRDAGVIPPVRDQSPYGLCWAFSSMAMAETSLIRQGLAEADEINLSEYHLGYYSHRFVTDPLGGTAGDNNYRQDLQNDILGTGAFYTDAKNTLSAWIGAVPETVTGYPEPPRELEASQEAAYGHNQAVLKDMRVIHYADEQEVKRAIMEYGAVGIAYHAPEESGANIQYFNYDHWAQYIPVSAEVNHAVTVVGWDDNYNRQNFGAEKPYRNGAWLVRNSWGETDFGIDGYFWLSYEDATIFENVYVFDMQAADVYDNNYQYDGSAYDQLLSMDDQMEVANLFTVSGNPGKWELLQAVSFDVYTTNMEYTIQIYTDLEDSSNPTSGSAALENPVHGTTTYTGYYTIPLGQDILLDQGEQFAVVIKFMKQGEKVRVVKETCQEPDLENVSHIEQGQSFYNQVRSGYNWRDMKGLFDGNWRIKAFTSDIDKKPVTGIVLSETSGSLKVGQTKQLTATIQPEDASDQKIRWESSAASVASVSSSGLVTALSQGNARITARTQDGGYEAVYRLEVEANPVITDVAVSQLEADSATITITANDGDREIADWTLEKNAGTGTPVITQQSQKNVFRVTGLRPVSYYEFLAKVTDSAGNRTSELLSLTTPKEAAPAAPTVRGSYVLTGDVGNRSYTYTIESIQGAEYRMDQGAWQDNPSFAGIALGSSHSFQARMKGTDTRETGEAGSTGSVSFPATIPVSGIRLSEATGSLKVGETKQLTAMVLPEDTTSHGIQWTSSLPSVAKVSSSGLVTALGQGSAEITARTEEGAFTAVFQLEVEADPVITEVEVSQLQADSALITITAHDGDREISSWSLEKVSGSGTPVITQQTQKQVFRITGLSPVSSYEFLAKATDSAGNSAEQRVTLTTPKEAAPSAPEVRGSYVLTGGVGNRSYTYTIEIIQGAEYRMDQGAWQDSPVFRDIALDSSHTFQARMKETATREAGEAGSTGSVNFRAAVPVSGILLSETSGTLKVGETKQLTAIMVPEDATNRNVQWTSSQPDLAAVSSSGLITALAPGSVWITACTEEGGYETVYQLKVEAVVVEPPVFTPPAGTYESDQQIRLSTETEGAEIYYTMDGTVPSADNGILYTAPIKVNRRQVIRAAAIKEGMEGSAVAKASYQLERPFPFADVMPDGKWKHLSVQYVYNNGIMSGVASETPGFQLFQADRPLSRSMFATVLYRMAGEPAVTYTEKFPDVKPGKWYSNAILWAYGEGIVSGLGDGRFGINDNITREQIAKMLYLYAEGRGYDTSGRKALDSFTDQDQVSSWATDYIQWATAVEMISGKPNEDGKTYRLDGKGPATRAECAAMLMRFESRYIPIDME